MDKERIELRIDKSDIRNYSQYEDAVDQISGRIVGELHGGAIAPMVQSIVSKREWYTATRIWPVDARTTLGKHLHATQAELYEALKAYDESLKAYNAHYRPRANRGAQ